MTAKTTSENNKRIAKNTLMLFFRMLLLLFIGLYTSRIVLANLGSVDYGVNNVVGGMVSMFVFLNGTLATGTQRFLTFALGEGDLKKQIDTFSTTFYVHLFMAIILGLVTLIVGYWFLEHKLVIPDSRMGAARWVFYCSVINIVLGMTQVPYSASVTAHEDMGVYAYMSIFDGICKLAIAYALTISPVDKLKLYAVLWMIVGIVDLLVYRIFCIWKYKECHVRLIFDKKLLKEILTFSGWNVMGVGAVMLNNQGMNVLLNLFFGPIVNAARGIANQINNIVNQLVGNFQTATNPQIIKYYAEHEYEKMMHLIFNASKFSGSLMMIVLVPIFFEIDFVLNIWLGKYPENTAFFVRVVLFSSFVYSMTQPVVMGIHAVGKMKTVNILAGSNLLMILPVSYLLLKLNAGLRVVMIVSIIPWFIEVLIESCLMQKYVGFSVVKFYKNVYGTVFPILIASSIVPAVICYFMEDGWLRFFIVGLVSVVISVSLVYNFSLSQHIREMVKNKVKLKLERWV